MPRISDVALTIEANGRALIAFTIADGSRFHFWCRDRETMLPTENGRRHKHPAGTLYKRGPEQHRAEPPRYLDAGKAANRAMIDEAIAMARAVNLWVAAEAEAAEKERRRLAGAAVEARQGRIEKAGPALLAFAVRALPFLECLPDVGGTRALLDEGRRLIAEIGEG